MGTRETISYQVEIETQCTCQDIERRCESSPCLKPEQNAILQKLQKKIIKMGEKIRRKGKSKQGQKTAKRNKISI
jgi:competence protein ComGF